MMKYLEEGNYPGLSGWTQYHHKDPYKRGQDLRGRHVMMAAESGMMDAFHQCLPGSRKAGSSTSWKGLKYGFSLKISRRNTALPTHFRLLPSRTVRQ